MKLIEWRDLIAAAVERQDNALLNSLAAHLSDCEEANRILRAKGYAISGQSIVDAARRVPNDNDLSA